MLHGLKSANGQGEPTSFDSTTIRKADLICILLVVGVACPPLRSGTQIFDAHIGRFLGAVVERVVREVRIGEDATTEKSLGDDPVDIVGWGEDGAFGREVDVSVEELADGQIGSIVAADRLEAGVLVVGKLAGVDEFAGGNLVAGAHFNELGHDIDGSLVCGLGVSIGIAVDALVRDGNCGAVGDRACRAVRPFSVNEASPTNLCHRSRA